MCKILKSSRSGYYCWLNRKPSRQEVEKQKISEKAEEYFYRADFKYGYRKVHEDITEEAKIDCCKETVRKVLAEKGLFFKGKRRFTITTDSRHNEPVAPNILKRDFTATDVNQKWVADITYIPTSEGWLYLAIVMDLFSRKIVGWSMDRNINAELVIKALKAAVEKRGFVGGLVHHSDRGVQYASGDFQDMLRTAGIVCSMSRKGNCWDNAVAESFFGKLKVEQVNDKKYRTLEEAKLDIFWYIEVFYNRIRRHASLGYVSPEEFEKRGAQNQTRAA